MAYSHGLNLLKPSFDRFLEQANYKNSWMMILPEPGYELNKNAEAVDIRHIRGNKLYFARAVFLIDRLANDVPFNWVEPRNQYIRRGLYIRKIRGSEIIQRFGVVDRLYLEQETIPTTSNEFAKIISDKFGLTMDASDIVDEPLVVGKNTCIIRFSRRSQMYHGEMLVDITTQAFEKPASAD